MKTIPILILLILGTNLTYGQGDYSTVLAKLLKVEQLLKQDELVAGEQLLESIQKENANEIQQNNLMGQVYYRILASYYRATSDREQAYEAGLQALDRTKTTPDSIQQKIKTYETVARVFLKIEKITAAMEIVLTLEGIYEGLTVKKRREQAYNYRMMGQLYAMKGEIDRGIEYFEKALAIHRADPSVQPIDLALVYGYKAIAYDPQKDAIKQKIAIEKALDYSQNDTSKKSEELKISMLNALGRYYIYHQENEKGLEVYEAYLAKTEAIRGKYHPSTAIGYMNIAIVYAQTGDLITSEQYFEKAIYIKTHLYGKHNASLALNYGNLASLLNMMNKPEKALRAAHQAFAANVIGYSDTNYLADLTPTIAQYEILDPINLISSLNNRGTIFYNIYLKTNDVTYLEYAYHNLLTQITILDKTKDRLSDKDKLRVLGENFMPYANGIDYAYELYQIKKEDKYLEMSFELAERSKDAILSSSLNARRALNIGNVPDSLIRQENDLKKKVNRLEKKIYNTQKEDKMYSRLQERLFDTKRVLEGLIQRLEQEYPRYLAYKNSPRLASITEIQTHLKNKNTAAIAYYVSKESIYYWTITSSSKTFHSTPVDSTYRDKAKEYRKLLTNVNYFRNNEKLAMASYKSLGHAYYQKLVAKGLEGIEVDNLIIIPDNFLGHLPFETFLTTNTNQLENTLHNLPYLMKDYAIQYSYSGNLLLQNHIMNQQLVSNTKVLGMAAYYNLEDIEGEASPSIREGLIPLPEATKEVNRLEEILEGTYFLGATATEANFKKMATSHGILHLAMHGILNAKKSANSALVFSIDTASSEDNFLYASEIVNLPIQSQLVVLSACETGYGKFEKGEGIMSLARSFMYAGVPSLVVSLWRVNDYSTAKVMEYFYEELKKGKTKSEALRLAKLTYISNTEGAAAHPAFWAAFIQLGDSSPVFNSSLKGMIKWYVLMGVILLGCVFVWWRRR